MTAVQQWLQGSSLRFRAPAAQWLDAGVGWTRSNANKTVTYAAGAGIGTAGTYVTDTYKAAGKRYYEALLTGTPQTGFPYSPALGIVNEAFVAGVQLAGAFISGWVFGSDGSVYSHSVALASGLGTHAGGQVLMLALDCSTKKLWVGRNGTWNGNPAAGTGEVATVTGTSWSPCFSCNVGGSPQPGATLRTQTSDFSYAAPSGFASWTGS
jgi:hypothetical protein